jgi:hypothetical protein
VSLLTLADYRQLSLTIADSSLIRFGDDSMRVRVEDVVEEGKGIYFAPSGSPDNIINAGVFLLKNEPASYGG